MQKTGTDLKKGDSHVVALFFLFQLFLIKILKRNTYMKSKRIYLTYTDVRNLVK